MLVKIGDYVEAEPRGSLLDYAASFLNVGRNAFVPGIDCISVSGIAEDFLLKPLSDIEVIDAHAFLLNFDGITVQVTVRDIFNTRLVIRAMLNTRASLWVFDEWIFVPYILKGSKHYWLNNAVRLSRLRWLKYVKFDEALEAAIVMNEL